MGDILYTNIPVEFPVGSGEIVTYLNARLIKKQELSEETVQEIVQLHQERLQIESVMKQCDEKHLKSLYAGWLDIQHDLQVAWKFGINDDFIKFWEVPRCTCPKVDNSERIGVGYFIVCCECPVHG